MFSVVALCCIAHLLLLSEAGAQQCGSGTVRNPESGQCVLDVGQYDEARNGAACDEGLVLNADATACVSASTGCPEGETKDADGTCSGGTVATSACEDGYTLGPDAQTCIADTPECPRGQAGGDDGECINIRRCEEGLILAADLLTCVSDGCPDGQILSVDGARCISPNTKCPDGSPRPLGGSCLVVETKGTEIEVRCDQGDQFCQALVKQCAQDRAAGKTDLDTNCEDPRGSCPAGDAECQVANERLEKCAAFSGSDDPADEQACDDLCPKLHRLDRAGQCVEYLDPTHPCVSFGRVPDGVTTNEQLNRYAYLAGTAQCVTRTEFLRRLANFEAAAEAEAEALMLLRDTTSSYLDVERELDGLNETLDAVGAEVAALRNTAAAADLQRVEAEAALGAARRELHGAVDKLRADAVSLFISGGTDTVVAAAVMQASTLSEVVLARAYGQAIVATQTDNIERVLRLETESLAKAEEFAEAKALAEESLSEALDSLSGLKILLGEAERLRAEQLERRDEEAALVSQLRSEKAAHAQQLGVFEQASREIADIVSESEFLVTNFEESHGRFSAPVVPAEIGSGFGPRMHPILGYVRNHEGLDFDAEFGQPIYASARGLVQIASSFGGYGRTVVLAHGKGWLTLYAHLSVIAVDSGDKVDRGEIVGFAGSTGLSTGPHLHFEIWTGNETPVDPLTHLDLELESPLELS